MQMKTATKYLLSLIILVSSSFLLSLNSSHLVQNQRIDTDWLTLNENEGTVPANGGSQNMGINFDTTGIVIEEVHTEEIGSTTEPNVEIFNAPVTTTINRYPLCAVYNLEISFINEITGQFLLTWMFPDSCFSFPPPTFQYFMIKRDGLAIGTTTSLSWSSWLGDYGAYCFTVIPVFDEGNGVDLSATTCIEWYVPELCWGPTTIYNEQWIDTQEEVILTLESCGDGMLDFTFPDYGSGYIIDVQPSTGQIPSGETLDITITYDATGFPVGLHDEWLKIETNDPLYQEDSILNQMLVYIPGCFYGTVTNSSSGSPMLGVTVTTGAYTTNTIDDGTYFLNVDAGTYDVLFSMIGFESVIVTGLVTTPGDCTEISVSMSGIPYPVPWVLAEPDTLWNGFPICHVSWGLPIGPYEIIYDDGEADDYINWALPGGAVGVRFTPTGYPANIHGGRLYVGDLYFPLGGQFAITIMDDDGVNGLPGTTLDSIWIDINLGGWVDFYGIFNTIIDEGDFYFIWYQGYGQYDAPIGIDTDLPTVYRSVIKPPGEGWSISPYQDFMIRAYMSGPNTNCDLDHYTIARVTDFDPELGPITGIITPIANPSNNYYTDLGFAAGGPGFVAYAITTMYTSCGQSEWIYSNIVSNGIDNEVTISVSLCNNGELENSEVALIGHDYPYELFQGITDTNGIVVFDSVIDGSYDLFVSKVGYVNSFGNGFVILNDTTIGIELIQKMYPPQNLYVDPLTSVATWESPLITQLYIEDFEGSTFPPNGWQATAIDVGWFRTDDASSGGWPVPPGDGFYAAVNDDMLGTGPSNSTMDYLITPQVDLRESDDFQLYFTQFYDGSYGHSAYVEYSYDQGITWEVIETMSPNSEWNSKIVDLSSISGPNSDPVMVAFHGDDHGDWASGWAVDNVEIKNGPAPILAYYVFLDNVFEAQTGWDETTYTFTDLTYGIPYEACVLAVYDCGASDPICTNWESTFLSPPLNLTDEYLYGTDEVPLMWNPPASQTSVPTGLISFNVFRDSVEIANVPYEGQLVGEWITYIDTAVESNDYSYWVSAIYDIGIFGFPGDYAESAWEGPDNISVVWGSIIPFFEGWDNGTFSFQNWTLNENSENWTISSQEGEPPPSAEFTWDPLLENDYSSTLTSYPIIVDYLTEGDLFLSFDLQLKDRNSTGNEKMLIEVYDGTIWHLAAEFTNSGKFSFTNNIINITDYASGNAINIRFNATGQNSFDIISWQVDNICIYRECIPPTDLIGYYVWNANDDLGIELCWDAPDTISKSYGSFHNNETIIDYRKSIRAINGFNIYRKEMDTSDYVLYNLVDYQSGQSSYCFFDAFPNVSLQTGYYYQVTANYVSNTDACESSPTMAYEIPDDDFVYVFVTELAEPDTDIYLIAYPNPVQDMLTVTSSSPMKQLTIINYVGQIIYASEIIDATIIELNTSSYQPGAYLVKIDTENGVVARRVIISR